MGFFLNLMRGISDLYYRINDQMCPSLDAKLLSPTLGDGDSNFNEQICAAMQWVHTHVPK